MRCAPIWLTLLAAAPPTDKPVSNEDSEKEMYLSVPHGSFPEITRYRIDGRLPRTGDNVSVLFEFRKRDWDVAVFRDRQAPVRLKMRSSRLQKVDPSRSLFWASNDESALWLQVPYGEPLNACFVNGDEVFHSIQLTVRRGRLVKVDESTFEKCKPGVRILPTKMKNGSIVIDR